MLSATSIHSLISLLRKTSYRAHLEEILILEDPLSSIDLATNKYLISIINKMIKSSSEDLKICFEILMLRWEFLNIQLALRGIIDSKLEYNEKYIPVGSLKIDDLKIISTMRSFEEVQQFFEENILPHSHIIREIVQKKINPHNLEEVDYIFLKRYHKRFKEGINSIKNEEFKNIMLAMLDEEIVFNNIKILLNAMYAGLNKSIDLSKLKNYLLSGKGLPNTENLIKQVQEKHYEEVLTLLSETSYRKIFEESTTETNIGNRIVKLNEKVDQLFYQNQFRKKYNDNVLYLGLYLFWTLIVETRNIRMLAHGICSEIPKNELRGLLIID